jgi:hypothetical protein
MEPVQVDLTGARSGFDPIDPGWYHAKITGCEQREVRNESGTGKIPAGTPMLNWEFTIQGPESVEGRKVWRNTALWSTTMGMVKEVLEATGQYTDEDLAGALEFDPEDVFDADVAVQVTKREYPAGSGDFTNDVRRIKRLEDMPESAASGSLLP